MEIPQLLITKKNGNESFHINGNNVGNAKLIDFWQWSGSDLLGNTARGILAEFIVAMAIDQHAGVRDAWSPYDLETEDGIKIKVKSSGYIQSWQQKDYSKIIFGIAPTRAWNPETIQLDDEPKRQADIYVFALIKHMDAKTIDPLNLDQWVFYVVSAKVLNNSLPNSKSVSLKKLKSIDNIECTFDKLHHSILNHAR